MTDETQKLDAAALTELVSHMTAGDYWRFTEQVGDKRQLRTMMEALHRVAVETGRANGEAIDVFLDRIEIGELLKIVGGGSPLAQAGGAGSRTSAATGE